MFKIAILGCENSHAATFLRVIRDENLTDIQVVGVYSCFPGEAEKLQETYGVPVADSYDAFVGQIDGLIITARNGDNHYKYAKPYLDSGIPMFIDKPITNSEEDARAFFQELKQRNIPVCGGSTLKHAAYVQELKAMLESGEKGQLHGGFIRCPLDINSEHGGFFFYAQHLVQIMCELFGYYPNSVQAYRNGLQVTCVVRYDGYDVTGIYINNSNGYYAVTVFRQGAEGGKISLEGAMSREFHGFRDLLYGKPMPQSYEDLFAPVFIMNAMERSLCSGHEEPVNQI